MKINTESITVQRIRKKQMPLIQTKFGMGQYYQPVNEDKGEHLYTHDYGNGLKLMEHSWMENNFVRTVENLLAPGQPWHKCHLTWAGDYGDRAGELYKMSDDNRIKPLESEHYYRYLINHDQKVYVDKDQVRGFTPQWGDGTEWKIHPLPLLTADGNGRGGGDFRGKDPNNLIGSWAGERISVSDIKPEEDYEVLIFDLVE